MNAKDRIQKKLGLKKKRIKFLEEQLVIAKAMQNNHSVIAIRELLRIE